MKHLMIYGASDDLVEVDGAQRDEHSLPSSDRGWFSLLAPNGDGVNIFVTYEKTGCWSVAVAPVAAIEDGKTVPADWQFTLFPSGGTGVAPTYSAVLDAIVSDDATLTWEGTA